MRKIPLTTYLQEVQSLIEHGEVETALTQLRQVLEQYPHHLQTYQLVGQALLKSGSVGTAEEFFQRVLSAQPNDQLAHSGMATAYEQQGKLDEALWHATRAYEQQPSNDTLRKTFFSLQHKRNGMQVDRLRLTRGTLARLYLRGGIYPQAIAEVQAALQEEPARPDLQTLLLECLWEAGNQEESRVLAQQILQDYPNNLLANRVMAKLTATADKTQYLEKVQRMNPLLGEIGAPESSETCWLDLSGEESEFLSQQSEHSAPADEAVEDTFLSDIFAQSPAVVAEPAPTDPLPDEMLAKTLADTEAPALPQELPNRVEDSPTGDSTRTADEFVEWLANPPDEVLVSADSANTRADVVEPSEIPDWLGEILSGTPEMRPNEAIANAEAQTISTGETNEAVETPAEPIAVAEAFANSITLQAPDELPPDDDTVVPALLPVAVAPAAPMPPSPADLQALDLAAIFGAVPAQPHISEATPTSVSTDPLDNSALYELSQLETQPVHVRQESPAEARTESSVTEAVDLPEVQTSAETIIAGAATIAESLPEAELPDNTKTEAVALADSALAEPTSEWATDSALAEPIIGEANLPTDEESAREFLEMLFETADGEEIARMGSEPVLDAVAELPDLPEAHLLNEVGADVPALAEINDLTFLEEPQAEIPHPRPIGVGDDNDETVGVDEQQALAGLEAFPVLPTPDWEAIEAQSNQQAKETPDWLNNVVSAPEENALADDMDWLPELSESQELRATATNLQGTDRHVVSNEPDWLADAKESLLPNAKNVEIPDWLHEAMASGANPPADSLNSLAELPATPASEEIPDWLQNVAEMPAAESTEPADTDAEAEFEKTFHKVNIPAEPPINEAISEFEAPLQQEPDWLKPTFDESQGIEDVLETSPDWLIAEPLPLDTSKIEAEMAEIEPPTSLLNEGMEGWLNDLLPAETENPPAEAQQPAPGSHLVSPAPKIDNFDDWLKNAIGTGEDTQGQPTVERTETPESAVMAELNQLSASSAAVEEASTEPAPLDDWLMRLPEAMGVEVETESPHTSEAPILPEAQPAPAVAEMGEAATVAEIATPSLPSAEAQPQESIESHLREHALLPQVDAWKPKTANLPADHLMQARDSLLDGLIPQAVQRYGKLVRSGKLIPSVIEDLQVAVKEQPRKHRAELYQVLGDALSKVDRLDEALEAYKQALQQL
jgi:tetratricopeptide (TPR) repeat protein